MLHITHDISVVFEICDSLGVMHGGPVAETGTVEYMIDRPRHPYSFLLQKAIPYVRIPDRELAVIDCHPPQLRDEVNFCTFADRCPYAKPECYEGAPTAQAVAGDDDHQAWCIRADEMEELAAEHLEPPADSTNILEEEHE
jgi:oligopeptide/dipeptide ABC transporter ATP-binding protein